MQLIVDIAGHAEPWRLVGSHAFERWLASEPWLREGGCRALALGRSVEIERVFEAVRRLVRGIDDGRTGARVERMDIDAPTSLQARLCRFYEVPSRADPHTLLRHLGRALRYERCCFFLTTRSDHVTLIDEATALSEAISKMTGMAAAFFVVDTTAAAADAARFDLSTGWPMEGLLHRATDEAARWRAYLHLLVGWEAGGRPTTATQWGEGCARIAIGDESELLRHLEHCARAAFTELEAPLREACLSGSLTHPSVAAEARLAGLVWCAPGETQASLSPWVRRAIRGRASHGAQGGQLTCDWLNRELLPTCFSIERHLLKAFAPRLAAITPCFSVEDRLGNAAAQRMLRGDAAEALDDPWAVASFGEIVRALRDDLSSTDRYHLRNIVAVRNGAAHGQPLGWAAVCGVARAYAEIAWLPER